MRVWGPGFDDVPVAFRNLVDPAAKDYDPRDRRAYAIPYAEYANKKDGLGYTWEFPEDSPKHLEVRQAPAKSRDKVPTQAKVREVQDEIAKMERDTRLFEALQKGAPVNSLGRDASNMSDEEIVTEWKMARELFIRDPSEDNLTTMLRWVRDDVKGYDELEGYDEPDKLRNDRRGWSPWRWLVSWLYRRGLGWHGHGQDNARTARRS
jgi:hypothetical protein